MKTGFAIAGFVAVALVVGVCAGCGDDNGEDALGGALVASYDYEEGDGDENSGNGSEDCRDARAHCEDNDASPSFEDSPVRDSFNPTLCLPFSTCEFHPA